MTPINEQLLAIVLLGAATFVLPYVMNRFADSRSKPK
jgi:hypothetical protein